MSYLSITFFASHARVLSHKFGESVKIVTDSHKNGTFWLLLPQKMGGDISRNVKVDAWRLLG